MKLLYCTVLYIQLYMGGESELLETQTKNQPLTIESKAENEA